MMDFTIQPISKELLSDLINVTNTPRPISKFVQVKPNWLLHRGFRSLSLQVGGTTNLVAYSKSEWQLEGAISAVRE